jgi:cell division protein YceG involved in septum cleavage
MSPRDLRQRTAEERERARAERERRRGQSGRPEPAMERPPPPPAQPGWPSAREDHPESDVAVEPWADNAAFEARTGDAAVEPRAEDAAGQPRVEDAAVEPRAEDAAGQPRVEDAAVEPRAEDAAVEPWVEDAAFELSADDAAVEPRTEDAPVRLRTGDPAVGPLAEQVAAEAYGRPISKPPLEVEPTSAEGLSPDVGATPAVAAEPLHPIAVKLPRPAPLPPRIPPPRPLETRRRGWPARMRVVALLALVLAVCGGLLAFILDRSKSTPKPVAPVAVTRVTIPEGETRAQIARIASVKGLVGNYMATTRRSTLLDPTHYGAPRGTPDLEGFLFPATYELYAGASASRLAAEQLAAFQENFGSAEVHRAHELHITPYQLLIVASMVEREALLEHDRARVAAVIYNRLRLGMALGIDSTLRYALHDYTKPLTEAQLRLDSPYNTRIHHGLPPTPISNPGLASIHAAAHPAHVAYLYYVNGADGCGELVFSDDYAEFEQDASAYRQTLAKNGGRVPTCHKR